MFKLYYKSIRIHPNTVFSSFVLLFHFYTYFNYEHFLTIISRLIFYQRAIYMIEKYKLMFLYYNRNIK